MSRSMFAFAMLLGVPLAVAGDASAQEAVSIRFAPDYREGAVQQREVEVKTDQTLTVAGMPLETHAETFMIVKEQAVAASSEGGWKFEGQFTQIQSDMEFPGGTKLSFNSNNPDQAAAEGQLAIIADALKATAGARWTVVTNGEHAPVSIEYVGDPFADVDPLVKGSSDPESLKQVALIELKRYPAEPVKPGDTWTRMEKSDLGAGQTITLEKEYTYAGSEERDGRTFDKVTSKSLTAEYKMDPASPSPAKVTDSELAVAASEGTLWYDRQARHFAEVAEKVQITGSLTLEISGQKYPSELDLTIATAGKSLITPPE